jgi:hypothetical protein
MAKKHRLQVANGDEYSVIGIAAQLKDFKMCLFLNQALGTKLVRDGEMQVSSAAAIQTSTFPFFRYFDVPNKINWYLVANRNHEQQLMINELKQLNFFLINDGIPPFMSMDDFVASVNNINTVQLAHEISPQRYKELVFMLQDLEMHVLELDRSNKP